MLLLCQLLLLDRERGNIKPHQHVLAGQLQQHQYTVLCHLHVGLVNILNI